MTSDEGTTVLETRRVAKTFRGVHALNEVSLALRSGEVHGLVGENGAGKSTLIKILTGFYRPDGGEVRLDGRTVHFAMPHSSQEAGVSAVYQEVNLIAERSVAENLFLGREPRLVGPLTDRPRMVRETVAHLGRLGLDINPRAKLRSLPLGAQQMVAIARSVAVGARVVILDEPTSALNGAEIGTLFDVVRRLRDDGIAVLFVSHRMSELYEICDRFTVLRDGRVVAEGTPSTTPRTHVVAAMLGRESWAEDVADRRRQPADDVTPVLEVRHLRWGTRVRDVSLNVRSGEIVGLLGLLGSGRTETLKTIFGAYARDSGDILVGGRPVRARSPAHGIRSGIAFLPEDRRSEGVFTRLSVQQNIAVVALSRAARWGIVRRRAQESLAQRYADSLDIRSRGIGQQLGELSGGNQQKVLIARWLSTQPKVVLLDDPTRGIDVGAKAEVHRAVRSLADEGLGVLMSSSETEELFGLCDRLVVLSEGQVTGEVEPRESTPDQVLELLAGEGDARRQREAAGGDQ